MIKDRFFRSFKSVWGILLWLFLLMVIASVWVLFTNSGSRFVLNQAMPAFGAKMGEVRGSIMTGLQIGKFKLENESMRIEADNIDIQVRWRDLVRSRAHVSLFSVDELRVHLLQGPAQAEVTPSSGFQLPKLPVEVLIDKVYLKRFSLIQADGSTLPVQLGELGVSGIKWTRESAGLVLDGIHIDHPLFNSLLKGDIQLEQLNNPDWPLVVNLYSSNQGKIRQSPLCLNPTFTRSKTGIQADVACNLDINLIVKGSLKELALNVQGSGQEVVLEGDGLISLFSPLLLQKLNLNFMVPNSTQVKANLDSKNLAEGVQELAGEIQLSHLNLSDVMPNSVLGAKLDINAHASSLTQWKQAALRAQVEPGSVWNSQTLEGDIDLALDLSRVFTAGIVQNANQGNAPAEPIAHQGFVLEDAFFKRADIDLVLGDNTLKTQGQFGEADSQLHINARLPKMAQIGSGIGYAAEIMGSLTGSMREHTLDLQGFYQRADNNALGDAPLDFQLIVNGAAKDLLRKAFWRGRLDKVYLKHVDFVLKSQEPTALEVEVDDTLQWQVGATQFTLQTPGGKVATISHKGSSQRGAILNSMGELKNLAISQSLMQQLGLPLDIPKNGIRNAKRGAKTSQAKLADVIYDMEWNVAQNPALNAQLNLQRRGTNFLPVRPDIPLDVNALSVQVEQEGKSNRYRILSQGQGEKSKVDVGLTINADSPVYLSDGHANVALSDGSGLRLQAKTHVQEQEALTESAQASATQDSHSSAQRVQIQLDTDQLDVYALSLGAVKDAKLSTHLEVDSHLDKDKQLLSGLIKGEFLPGSIWQGQKISGHLRGELDLHEFWQTETAQAGQTQQTGTKTTTAVSPHYEAASLKKVDIDVQMGTHTIQAKGDLGMAEDHLLVKADVQRLSDLLPGLHGGIWLNATLKGMLYAHALQVQGHFIPHLQQKDNILNFNLDAIGGSPEKRLDAWAYTIQSVEADFAEMKMALQSPLTINYAGEQNLIKEADSISTATPTSVLPAIWQIGSGTLQLTMPNGRMARLEHEESKVQGGEIHSKGELTELSVSEPLYQRLMAMVNTLSTGAKLAASPASLRDARQEMVFKGHWDIDTSEQMKADVVVERTNGSGVWPVKTPVPLDFDRLSLQAIPREQHQGFDLRVEAQGQNSHIHSTLWLDLKNPLFLQEGTIDLQLPDKTGVKGFAKVDTTGLEGDIKTIDVDLDASHLALDKLSYGAVPPALISGKVKGQGILSNRQGLLSAHLFADFAPGSIWNKQKLAGKAELNLQRLMNDSRTNSSSGLDAHIYLIQQADIDLSIGSNVIKTAGAFGSVGDNLNLDIRLSRLADLYPGLAGGVKIKGQLKGAISNHEIDLAAEYVQKGRLGARGAQPIHVEIGAAGGWGSRTGGQRGWSGAINKLHGSFQGFSLRQDQVAGVYFSPADNKGQPEWNLGSSSFTVNLPSRQTVKVQQLGSTGKDGLWTSKGAIKRFVLSPAVINDVNTLMGSIAPRATEKRGGVIVRNPKAERVSDLIFDIDWDLGYNGVLLGDASIQRLSGDIVVPTEMPFALGLTALNAKFNFQQKGQDASVLQGKLAIQTRDKGDVAVDLRSEFKGLQPNLAGGTSLHAKGNLHDIAWASAFTHDLLTLGGSVDFDVALQSRANRQWDSRGHVNGRDLRIVEIENGVRLLNGTLRASFNNTTVKIDTLHFPSVIRVMPSEWRTRQWIQDNQPAQNGSLSVSGQWDIARSRGEVNALLDHYPIIQRTDRFVMLSGELNVDAALPKISLGGKLTADSGWASIDILDTVPTVDSDVVVLKPGQIKYVAPPADNTELSMNLTVDLGPRFYLVGMGLNSGLIGSITLLQEQGRLTAEGEFRTRGGAIEAYGQRLQIRRGQIAFAGNITNPALNIEAIRGGTEVEAGLRVIGTAKNPKITLVSYPDVSEVEKLSWLIMGRGPDSSGADLALLFSVGSSLIGGEEPFYRKLGLDDIGVTSGGVGDSDNILPDRTVADSTAYRGSGEEDQFFYASKKFGDSWKVNLEQALTGTGTVLRGSYQLMRYMTVDLKAGTVNGLEFVYRRFFAD